MKIDDGWHRRQAVAIASTLPESIDDARKILHLSAELLDGFLSDRSAPSVGGAAQANRPQRRPLSPTATKLWLAAALVLSIIIPSPIFQGNSIFVTSAQAAGHALAEACVPQR